MRPELTARALLAFLAIATAGCRSSPTVVESATSFAAPSPDDRGDLCADVGNARACWGALGARCIDGICSVPRVVPTGAPPPGDWRCGRMRGERRCEGRQHNGAPMRCEGDRCAQKDARRPDDGEWECVEMDGVVYCHSLADAAGVGEGHIEAGWLCGDRRGAPGERICVDFAPDRPPGAGAWRCRTEATTGEVLRVCTASSAPLVGDACEATRACPNGSRCVDGHCLPLRPSPSCWFDKDCGAGRCRWGTCLDGPS